MTSTVSLRDFKLAAEMLRALLDGVIAQVTVEVLTSEVEIYQQNILAHERAEDNLRDKLHRVLPFVRDTSPTGEHETHVEQIVHRMVRYIDENYTESVSLADLSHELKMNPSYLSALFSQVVGLPFTTYLKERRFEKAHELLCDPPLRISEIARAVGYADPNHFRQEFKARTGLSPSAWRETLRVQ